MGKKIKYNSEKEYNERKSVRGKYLARLPDDLWKEIIDAPAMKSKPLIKKYERRVYAWLYAKKKRDWTLSRF